MIGHQHQQSMLPGIPLQQRAVDGIPAFADQHTGGIDIGPGLCSRLHMAGMAEVRTNRQGNLVLGKCQGRAATARGKSALLSGMQMLLAIDRQRTIAPQHQRTDQYRSVINQANRQPHHRSHLQLPRQVAQGLQYRRIRSQGQLGRQLWLVAGQRQLGEYQQLHALLRRQSHQALVSGEVGRQVSGNGHRLGSGKGQQGHGQSFLGQRWK
ncbi:hypothetical protein P308_18980 [Pseudomonas piscis]|nr:hypothetical protein P308_18980 [Pseudomonas piscis]